MSSYKYVGILEFIKNLEKKLKVRLSFYYRNKDRLNLTGRKTLIRNYLHAYCLFVFMYHNSVFFTSSSLFLYTYGSWSSLRQQHKYIFLTAVIIFTPLDGCPIYPEVGRNCMK